MSDIGKNSWLKIALLKLKTFFISKDVLSFLVFLLIATAFWFVHTLDRERRDKLKVRINYTGIPEDVEIKNAPPKEIYVTIRDEGGKLLEYARRKAMPLNIDLTRVYFSKGKIIISPDQLKTRLSNYFLPTTAVLKIEPDSIVIMYQKLSTKEVPVKLSEKIPLAQQYILTDSVRIEPSKVKVFGPRHILDTLKAVYIEKLDLKNIKDTVQIQSKLVPQKDLRYSFSEVNIGVFVEMFTENKTILPVTLINAPSNMNVRIFPVTVNVSYNVGLTNFKKINPNDLKVVFDYNDVADSQKRKNKLRVINNSPYISNIRVMPDEVEFLLEKK